MYGALLSMQELGFVSQYMATGYVHDLNINFTVIFPEQTAKAILFTYKEKKPFCTFVFFTFKSVFAYISEDILQRDFGALQSFTKRILFKVRFSRTQNCLFQILCHF